MQQLDDTNHKTSTTARLIKETTIWLLNSEEMNTPIAIRLATINTNPRYPESSIP